MAGWTWDAVAKRFISPSGKPLTEQATVQLRNRFAAARSEIARALAEQLNAGTITPAEFATAFEQFIQDTITTSYLVGRGGANAIMASDESAILKMIRDQLNFGDEFVKSITDLSPDDIANRASLYGDAAVKAFERGKSAAWGVDLPGYPGDWETACKAGCRCYWSIVEQNGETTYRWITASDSSVCADCAQRGIDWNPWVPG